MDYLVHHMLRTSVERFSDEEALVEGERRLSYLAVWETVSALADNLRQHGIERGDRVGVFLEPSIAHALAVFGISKAGGVFVPINTALFPDQVSHIANDCRMKAIVSNARRLTSLREALPSMESLAFVISTDSFMMDLPKPTYLFGDMCAGASSSSWREQSIEKDLAALIYTSGSTGRPKGVMLSHAQIMAGASIISDYLEITDRDRTLAALPFSFDAGLNQLMTAFLQGATLVPMTFTFAREIVNTLVQERITGMGGVPTLWSLLAQPSSTLHKHRLPHLRYISNTGGAMPIPVVNALRKALPSTKVFLMYGLTEAFRSTYLPPEEVERRPSSIGRAIPNTEILVINAEGRPCAPGEVGELVHRGPTVSMGYWGQPELTAKVLRANPLRPPELGDSERVCYSGDLVKMDEEGFLYFVGRRDTLIKSSGYRISPTEVECALFESGKLREAAVIGIPDELLGQAIKAFVVAKDGESLDAEYLLAFCAGRIPRYMVPRSVEILETLPKTGNGKIDYQALRRREGLEE